MKYGQRKRFVKISAAPQQQENQQKKPFLGRIGQGMFGSGLAISNFRNAATYANPNQVLYHGTAPENAAAILGGGGLDVRYAGYAKRLNSIMLANAGGKAVMDAGISVDDDLLAEMSTRAASYMGRSREAGMEGFDSVRAVEQATREVLTERGMDPSSVEKLITETRPKLKEAGKRIYMANTPRVAGMYGEAGVDELDMMKKKLSNPMGQLRTSIKTIGNVLTGGVIPEAMQTADAIKYNQQLGRATNVSGQSTGSAQELMQLLSAPQKTPGTRVNRALLADKLRQIDPNITEEAINRLEGLANQGKLGTTFGVGASRRNMKSLSDFPLLSNIMALSPGIKHSLSDYLDSLDPTKDLSVPESIPLQDFRNMDLTDTETGTPLLRMSFNNPKRTVSLGERAIGLRKAAPFAALGLLGADVVQDAIRQKGMYAGKPFKALKQRLEKRSQEKQAGILSGSTKQGLKELGGIAKKIAIPVAGITATGVGASKAYGASADFIQKHLESPEMVAFKKKEKERLISEGKDPREAEDMAAKASRMAVLSVVGAPVGMAAGLLTAAATHPKTVMGLMKGKVDESGKGLMSLPLTAYAGMSLVPGMMQRSEETRLGKDLSDQSALTLPFKGSKIEKFVRDNPEFAGIPDVASLASLPLLTGYVGKKHYSGHYSKLKRGGNRGFREMASKMNRGHMLDPGVVIEEISNEFETDPVKRAIRSAYPAGEM